MTLTETYKNLLEELAIPQGGEMVYRFCDKGHNHSYLDFYEKYFAPHHTHASILEIGVMTGGSLLLWQRWFDSLRATGIDLREGYNETFAWQKEIDAICHWGVDSTVDEPGIELDQYQFIIDDGDHTLAGQWATFKNFWDLVRPGGTYFIEDIETQHNTDLLRDRITQRLGDTVSIEHYRGHTREDDQILAITRKIS